MQNDLLGGLFDTPEDNVYIDGDTVKDLNTGESLRIQGIDTPEVAKVTDEGFQAGEVGGQLTANLVSKLAEKEGYTQPLVSGEKDVYGRYVGDLANNQGKRLSTQLLQSGLADVTIFSDKGQIQSALMGRLDQAQRKSEDLETDWDIAKFLVNKEQQERGGELKAKPIALDEREYAMAPDYFAPGVVQIRSDDRTIDNKAKNSLTTAFALGISNVEEGAWGAWDLIGDVFNVENTGEGELARVQRAIADMPELENQVAFDEEGNWRLDSASKVVDFVITNAAMSAPYMIQSILSVAAAPYTFGASLAIPSVVYTGQTYNAQEEKNAATAIISGIGQGVLERLGLKGVEGATKGFLKDNALKKKVVEQLAANKYKGNVKLAEQAVANETVKELVRFSQAAKDSISFQFANKYLSFSKDTGQAFLKGSASEALTETGQELLGSLGEKNFDFSKIDQQELQNRLLNAAVAGGTLGGTLSSVSQVRQNIGTIAALDARKLADASKASFDYKYRQELIDAGATEEELDIRTVASETNEENNLNDRVEKYKGEKDFATSFENTKEEGLSQLWRGFSANLNNRFGDRGINIRKLFGLITGNNVFFGGGTEDYQHLTESSLNNIVGSEQEILGDFNTRSLNDITDIFSNVEIRSVFDKISSLLNNPDNKYLDAEQAYNDRKLSIPAELKSQEKAILKYFNRFYKYNQEIERLTGKKTNIFEEKTFNKIMIAKDRQGFVDALKKAGLSATKAEQVMKDILEIPNVQQSDDLFDFDLLNTPLKASDLDINKLRETKELNQFLDDDLFYNLSAINGKTAAKLTNNIFLGKNGSRLAYYIEKAVEAGEITEEEANYLASEMKDYIDIRKGEYKRIENETWRAFQENALFLTILNQLPLATISSIVELGLITNNINKKVIFEKGFIKDTAKRFALEFYDLFNEGVYKSSRGRIKRADTISKDSDRLALFELGFLQESQSVAQKNDVNAGVRKQKAINSFFRFIGLQSLTNFTRSTRLALAGDAINGWVYDVATETELTKQSMEAREALIELGVDIEFMVRVHKDPSLLDQETNAAKYDDQMRRASFRFVNQAIAHPTKSNRPKFYQNPRTALFFQFQGFISTFTSTILPKIYSNLVNSNMTASTRMETAATIATLLLLGFMSQYLRDLIKYGEETPYLDDLGKFQRAVGASGLMGSGERIVNTIFPLYDTSSDGWIDAALDEISGQAPVLGYGGKLTDAVNEIVTGGDRVASRIQKAAPGVGPINQLGWALDDLFD